MVGGTDVFQQSCGLAVLNSVLLGFTDHGDLWEEQVPWLVSERHLCTFSTGKGTARWKTILAHSFILSDPKPECKQLFSYTDIKAASSFHNLAT